MMLLYGCEKKESIKVEYFSNGDTSKIAHFDADGLLNGFYQEYFENGRIKSVFNYRQGSLAGVQKEYFENGTLKTYSYLENDTVLYQKRFNEQGALIGGKLGVKSPKEMYKNSICSGDSLTIGYSLVHSYLEDSYIAMDVIELNDDHFDTLISMYSDTTIITYYYKPKWNGKHSLLVNVYEASFNDDNIVGYHVDTLDIESVRCE